jgi:hypothetical protein
MKREMSKPRHRRIAAPPRTATLAPCVLALAAAAAGPLHAQTTGAPATSSANAGQPPAFPVRVLDRPTTLPKGAIRFDVYGLGSEVPGSDFATTGILGGGWGVTERLEMGGQIVPVTFSPSVEYTNPSLYATYAFQLSPSAAIAPLVQTVLPLRDGDPFTVDLGAAISVNLGAWGEFESAPTLSINTREDGSGSSFSVPLTLMRQASTRFNWQVSTGIGFSRFDTRHWLSRRLDALDFDEVTVPASVLAMYTLPHGSTGNALVDFSLLGQFPQLYGNGPDQTGWETGDWTIQLQMSWYFVRSTAPVAASPASAIRNR